MVHRLINFLLTAFICVAFSTVIQAQIEGEYESIGTLPAKHSMEVVVYEEYLNFTCPHCNNFRKAEGPLLEKYGSRLEIHNIPVLFRGQADEVLRLFFIAQREGKEVEMKNTIFDASFKYGVNINDSAIVSYLARSAGLGKLFQKERDAEWVNQKIAESGEMATAAGISATPTIILAGTIRVTPRGGMDAFIGNLSHIIDQLLKK